MKNRLHSQIMAAKNVRLLLQEATIAFQKGDDRRALGHALTALGDLLRAFNNAVSIRDEGKKGAIKNKLPRRFSPKKINAALLVAAKVSRGYVGHSHKSNDGVCHACHIDEAIAQAEGRP